MKILKIVLLTIISIIALLLIVALFAPKNYEVQRETIISAPKAEVFNYIKYLKNQDKYSKWATMDENMESTFSGIDGTVGFISAWKSENPDVGEGEQEITAITEGKKIEYELRFIAPFESKSPAFITTESTRENITKVVWGFSGNIDYPMNLMLLMMDFELMIGDDLQYGLDKLKGILENQ